MFIKNPPSLCISNMNRRINIKNLGRIIYETDGGIKDKTFVKCPVSDFTFDNIYFRKIEFNKCIFSTVIFNKGNFDRVQFKDCTFIQTTFDACNFEYAEFYNCNFIFKTNSLISNRFVKCTFNVDLPTFISYGKTAWSDIDDCGSYNTYWAEDYQVTALDFYSCDLKNLRVQGLNKEGVDFFNCTNILGVEIGLIKSEPSSLDQQASHWCTPNALKTAEKEPNNRRAYMYYSEGYNKC